MRNEKLKKAYKAIMLIIVVALVTFVLTSVFMYNKLGTTSKYTSSLSGINTELLKKIYSLRTIIDSKYISEVNEKDLVNGAIKGYVEGLGDDYTQYADTEVGYFGKILGKISSLDGNKIVLLNNFTTGGGNVNTNNKVINDLATKFNAIVVDIKNSNAYTNHDYHTQNGYYNAVHFNSVGNQYIANLVNNKIQEEMNINPMKFNMYKIHE